MGSLSVLSMVPQSAAYLSSSCIEFVCIAPWWLEMSPIERIVCNGVARPNVPGDIRFDLERSHICAEKYSTYIGCSFYGYFIITYIQISIDLQMTWWKIGDMPFFNFMLP